MWTRRQVLKVTTQLGAATALPGLVAAAGAGAEDAVGVEVNDVQSQLNATRVRRIARPRSIDDIQTALRAAREEGRAVSIAGGRHAMGGQQFGRDTILLDMTGFARVLSFDRTAGRVEVEGGIEWPELIDYLQQAQAGERQQWAIREKQSGVDRVSLGGSLAANIHGRGLRFAPLIADVESFTLLDAAGNLHTCNRRQNTELFALAIGGYGLFGVIAQVTLRLVPRVKLRRLVEVVNVRDLLPRIDACVEQGYLYGDWQYSTDLEVDDQAHPGILSCYQPVDRDTPIPPDQKELSGDDWAELYLLARSNRKKAFETYSRQYLGTSGQIYWADSHQLAGNFDGYRKAVDPQRGTEMITEVYVTRDALLPFLSRVRQDFREHHVDLTYGTLRFIEKDTESFLRWARERFICIVFNLHVVHTDEGKQKAATDFRRILDRVIEHGGSYYLTYHRWATRKHVETCYPQFAEFLRLKKKYDPGELFQSNWYRHYKEMFS
jgi:FAD/FMN-containing dehydrogenase